VVEAEAEGGVATLFHLGHRDPNLSVVVLWAKVLDSCSQTALLMLVILPTSILSQLLRSPLTILHLQPETCLANHGFLVFLHDEVTMG
jgi:hypothetical protein